VKLQRNNFIIHSGGQTGVDRAALDFALCNGICCAGWCPQQRMAEDGFISLKYPLRQTHSSDTFVRTELNVKDCDATLIIVYDEMDRGTQITYDLAKIHQKPVFVWIINKNINTSVFHRWLYRYRVEHLNIAGPRESNAPGMYFGALAVLDDLLLPVINQD
jgi:hypothetical protein